jgi:hypothetical protein
LQKPYIIELLKAIAHDTVIDTFAPDYKAVLIHNKDRLE